jgi:hypothetical protein
MTHNMCKFSLFFQIEQAAIIIRRKVLQSPDVSASVVCLLRGGGSCGLLLCSLSRRRNAPCGVRVSCNCRLQSAAVPVSRLLLVCGVRPTCGALQTPRLIRSGSPHRWKPERLKAQEASRSPRPPAGEHPLPPGYPHLAASALFSAPAPPPLSFSLPR